MHFLQAINSDISVLIVCNKTGGTIKGDIKKKPYVYFPGDMTQKFLSQSVLWSHMKVCFHKLALQGLCASVSL